MKLPLTLILAIVSIAACAQEVATLRPVRSAYMLEAGSAHVTNTYLSPLNQNGWCTALAYERSQAMRFNPRRWVMQLGGRLALGRTRPQWRNAPIWDADINFAWAMLWRHNFSTQWQLRAGGYTDISAGALYATHNGNNPVSAKASWTVGPRVELAWSRKVRHIPVRLAYRADLPVTGCFFTPQYGELYYEIYLGNHTGLVHAAWPGNFFRLRNLITADISFGATTLRLGYRCNIESIKANNIINNETTHTAVLGIVCDWIALAPGRKLDSDLKIIY